MKKEISTTRYCGIDIAAASIDVCFQNGLGNFQWEKFENSSFGFKQLIQLLGVDYHFVMESTGVYHLALCFYLETKKCRYSVVNALQIKRYIQMHLERNKTDQIDAKYICEYGIANNPPQYEMPDALYFECKSLTSAIETLTQEITSFKNKLYSLGKIKTATKAIVKSYKHILKTLAAELVKLEQELAQKLSLWQPKLVKQVSSVIGIGKRASSLLIVYTQGFKNTATYQQLISYAGLSPKLFISGSSIRGKVKICKQGGKRLRHVLYMCSLNAKANNPACKALYDRLVAKGKNKKLALIAVCNKLLKQVFGVVKNDTLFEKNYLQKTA